MFSIFFFQAEDGIRDYKVTGVQTCALPISHRRWPCSSVRVPAAMSRASGFWTRTMELAPHRACRSQKLIHAEYRIEIEMRVDRKSVVKGKRVDLGGRRIIKKKKRRIAE